MDTFNLKKIKLEIIVFVSGAVVMILEMVGSRVFSPYLGTSIYIWTSLIGVIMGSLSLGYYLGGRIADRGANYKTLSNLLLAAGFLVFLMNITKGFFLTNTLGFFYDSKSAVLLISMILFFPSSTLLGMISPYAVKLKLDSLSTSGSTVGNLYAISTVGSIFGTFLAGFYLIAFFGTTKIIYFLAIVLVLLALYAHSGTDKKTKLLMLLLFGSSYVGQVLYENNKARNGFVDVDTQYNRVWIYDELFPEDGRPVRRMNLNRQNASAMYLDGSDIVFSYQEYYNLIKHFNPTVKDALLLGGAAYSYPKEFMRQFPQANIDVVEIDPGLTKLAQQYFNLKMTDRLGIFHEDARIYLNDNKKQYDAIYMDAFDSYYSIPGHLTTKEAVQKIYDSLNDGGILFTNLISSLEGDMSGFLNSEYFTYKAVFPEVLIYKVKNTANPRQMQNLVLVAFKNIDMSKNLQSDDAKTSLLLKNLYTKEIKSNGLILTDEFVPIERFFIKIS